MLGIIDAMTPSERDEPWQRIDAGRLRRIAAGAGTVDQQVIRLLIDFHGFQEVEARGRFHERRCGTD